MTKTVLICPYCASEVSGLGPDLIDYCSECEIITESYTLHIDVPDDYEGDYYEFIQ